MCLKFKLVYSSPLLSLAQCLYWLDVNSLLIPFFIFLIAAVSHILEIYDFPENIGSDLDAIFDDVRNSGARILKINSSSSQSSGHNSAVVKPTILAIFKSSSEAQKALETVKSQYYKLRVSKKSPTHLSSSDYPSHSSNQPAKSA